MLFRSYKLKDGLEAPVVASFESRNHFGINRQKQNGLSYVEILKSNYGHAGIEFVELIQGMKNEELQEIQKGFYSKIVDRAKKLGLEKEEKQILPMSILFTADYLTEKYLFKDGILLDFEKCVDLLKNKGEVSENERAYQYIIVTGKQIGRAHV